MGEGVMVRKKQLPASQFKLSIDKTGELKPVRARAKVEIVYKAKQFTCPYCLYSTRITQFLIRLKHGNYSEKRFHCPDCGQIMNKETLTREQSIEEYAEWILDTNAWERISFNKFKKRLKEMGISYQFWAHYKKYKAEVMEQKGEEEYEQYEASQEEWAKERGYI